MKDEERNHSQLFHQDSFYFVGLLVAAIVLYTFNLGELPLRDWDEGIVAGVARNIWRSSPEASTWLYPTINNGQPYWNKPPLVHWLIAISYNLFGVSEWSTRLAPALLSAFSIPLLYQIGREIFTTRLAAILSALVYLTLLPMARHGRVAMLDGAIACWFCLAILCFLRGRNHRHWLLGTGIGLGLICLTKGIMMGVLLGGIILIFGILDCPQLLVNPYLWAGFILGGTPAIAWYWLQYSRYGEEFLGISLGKQTFSRIWEPVSHVSGPPWYYLLEIAKYSLPWLIFLPRGVRLAFKNSRYSWGKLTLVWSGVYLLAISLMVTKLPWYVIPIYPGLSLLIGASLAAAWKKGKYPYTWKIYLSLITVICWVASVYFGVVSQTSTSEIDLALILVVVAVSFTWATVLLWRASSYFIPVIVGGFYLALLLLFNSSHWLWELNEAFPVKPVAAIIKQYAPPNQTIHTTYPYFRPSLEFYSDRRLIPTTDEQIKQYWQQNQPVYLLLEPDAISKLNLQSYRTLGNVADDVGWLLITQAN
ncbi:glycosyltransferase family 39 protein [Pleurocapsa sp. PCC 7319]|uniref:ArnT family glycosyltransferase n=1 Tax=Pleurocapsa sp. PCC 7319 TaxID=118161 RepID=UPI00034860B8|nr:glycosyltransferase family 39 protein [Pleurocapsa sp. PCC 7319]